ncbi:hypothetical protein Gotur_022220 [Gossypium turneri]
MLDENCSTENVVVELYAQFGNIEEGGLSSGRMRPKGELMYEVSVQDIIQRQNSSSLVAVLQHEKFNVETEGSKYKNFKTAFGVATQL